MSKIVKNTTASPYSVADVGVTIPASPGSYTIPAQDFLLWAASGDVITGIGSGDLLINDGSNDLSISDGTDLIKGIFPKRLGVLAGTDLGQIGRVLDQLKVRDADAISVLNSIAIAVGGAAGLSIFRQNEATITAKIETDLPSSSYTVPAGKTFLLTSFATSYDFNGMMYVRLKKQTGGSGPFVTQFRFVMMAGGQGESTLSYSLGNGVRIGSATDVFKITYEAAIVKGTIWAEFSGSEI